MSDLSSIGFARYAIEFQEAADAVEKELGMQQGLAYIPLVPVMYLTGHSIELILKSYLIYKNITEKQLRKIGHDLERCCSEAAKHDIDEHISLSELDEEVLSILNVLYKSKQLNYMEIGFKKFPDMNLLANLNKRLLQKICPLVGYKYTVQQKHNESKIA